VRYLCAWFAAGVEPRSLGEQVEQRIMCPSTSRILAEAMKQG